MKETQMNGIKRESTGYHFALWSPVPQHKKGELKYLNPSRNVIIHVVPVQHYCIESSLVTLSSREIESSTATGQPIAQGTISAVSCCYSLKQNLSQGCSIKGRCDLGLCCWSQKTIQMSIQLIQIPENNKAGFSSKFMQKPYSKS